MTRSFERDLPASKRGCKKYFGVFFYLTPLPSRDSRQSPCQSETAVTLIKQLRNQKIHYLYFFTQHSSYICRHRDLPSLKGHAGHRTTRDNHPHFVYTHKHASPIQICTRKKWPQVEVPALPCEDGRTGPKGPRAGKIPRSIAFDVFTDGSESKLIIASRSENQQCILFSSLGK